MSEEWKPIPGWPSYEASNFGAIRCGSRTLAIQVMASGYCFVRLRMGRQHTRAVHRLVLETFIGLRPAGLVCRHLDGDKTNNRLDNLRWGTASENMADQYRLRERIPSSGELNGSAKLTPALVAEIRLSAETQTAIAKRLGVHQSTISLIRSRRRWR